MSNPSASEKSDIRRAALARRAALGAAERAAAAKAIIAPCLGLAASHRLGPVALFASIRDEIDTLPLAEALTGAGYAIALPVVTGPDAPLAFRTWSLGKPLTGGYKGIPEPMPDAPMVQPTLVFVPLAAFDRRGHRLGYGAGFYDRALPPLKAAGALAVGLAFAVQEVPRVPDLPHDVPLDAIVTERAVIVCGQAV